MKKNRSGKKSVFKIIGDVIFGAIMAFFGTLLIFSIVEKSTGKSISGYKIVWIMTGSMEDTIPEQSYILVKTYDGQEIKKNDVIMFKSIDPDIENQSNTHRVVDITETGQYITKGDNSTSIDKYPVSPEKVEGIYVRNLPFLTFVGRLYAKPIGYVMTLLLISGTCMIYFAIDKKKQDKKEKDEYIEALVQKEVERLESEDKKKGNLKDEKTEKE